MPKRSIYLVARIQRDMARLGWNPRDLAREAGVSEMTISRFLSGKVQTPRTLNKVALALGKTPDTYLRAA